MRGRAIANRASTRGELDRAVAYFEAAVRADPAYAQPLARMAMVYQSTSGADSVPPSFAYPAAEQAARRAVAIDPSNAEAHATLGWALAIRTWNWTEARREMETAIRLDPSSSVAHGNFGFLLGTEGDLRGALREADEAIRLDPYQFINHLQAIFWHLVLGQPDSALAAGRRKDEYLPGVEMPDLSISDALRESGNVDSALVIDRAMSKMVGRPTSQLVMSLERKGLHAQAVAAYDTLVQTSRRQFIAPEFLARAALAIGNRSAALQWLREAKAMHSDIMVFMRWLPDMQPLLRDPEYRQQLEEMHLSARPKTR